MKEVFEKTLLFPTYRARLEQAATAAGPNMKAVAAAVGKVCRECGITDFPNPFKGANAPDEELAAHGKWAVDFGVHSQTEALDDMAAEEEAFNTPPVEQPEPEEINLLAMTRSEIRVFIRETYKKNIPCKWKRNKMMERAREIIDDGLSKK